MRAVQPHSLADILHPLELSEAELGDLADSLLQRSDTCVRLRSAELSHAPPLVGERVPWHGRGMFVDYAQRPGSRLSFAASDYYVQDAGSLLAVTLAKVRPGEFVCDLCAAPGGKSTAFLEEIGATGWLLANEAVLSRVAPLELNLARHGTSRFVLSQQDPGRLPGSLTEFFDLVVVDAPCSGQSLLGRGKQTASAFQPATIEHCARRQSRILDAASTLVRPGGRLVYSTCTFAYVENEARIAKFLVDHPDWQPKAEELLSPWEVPGHPGCYRLWPHRDRCAGAFAALVEYTLPASVARHEWNRTSRRSSGATMENVPRESREWGEPTCELFFLRAGDQMFAWTELPPPQLLEVAHRGPEFAFRKHATWFPSYALAMRRDGAWHPRARLDLDEREAAAYVRGDVVATDLRGWAVACWQQRALGWLKADGRVGKNHLPKPARLKSII